MSPMSPRLLRPRANNVIAVAKDASGNVIQPVTYSEGGENYVAHIFTTSGTLEFRKGVLVDYLIVAGGGGGVYNIGGGGGRGGNAGGAGGSGTVIVRYKRAG